MPVQQAIDVAVPIETAYNQFTQFEDWPTFMFRVNNVSQEDDCSVNFTVKMWGFTREYTAKIETQRPDERIKWKVSQGITHTGVVTFHELADRLTRIEVNVDVDPGSLIEKAARGMRHVKRAIRADLHRFKAFIEMQEIETGAWRGVIEDGELVEEHPEEYDEERDYSDAEDAVRDEDSSEDEEQSSEDEEQSSEDEEQSSEGDDEDDDGQDTRSERFKRQVKTSSGGSRSRSGNGNGNDSGSRSRPGKPRKPAGRR
jgi:cobalamin biosynthesis protein CobT